MFGETVNPGVVILSLDKSADELQLGKMNEELASRLNQKQRLQLNMESTIIELQTNYEIQRLKTESFRTNYENEKYIKSLGGTTEEMVKQAELQSKIAQLEIDHLNKAL
ncbi:MAG: hypothetical protein HC905_25285 [Bacteroidales bacterium]|nr:hypothetical protein [Bacteroidales bacterium]